MSNILIDTILRDVPHMVHFAKDSDGIKETKLYSEEDLLAALTAALDGVDERAGEVVGALQARATNAADLGYQTSATDLYQAAELITATLAKNAALRAERDALKRHNNALSQMLDGEETRADAAEAEVEKLRTERDDALIFLDNAVSKAPEPLKVLGKYLAERLDEDEWPTTEQHLNAAAKASQAAEAKVEKLSDALRLIDRTTEDNLARRIAHAALAT